MPDYDDWPIHRPYAPEAPIPGTHWYGGCDPDHPRVNPDGICVGCSEVACPACGYEPVDGRCDCAPLMVETATNDAEGECARAYAAGKEDGGFEAAYQDTAARDNLTATRRIRAAGATHARLTLEPDPERIEVYSLRSLSSCASILAAERAVSTHEEDGDEGPYLIFDTVTGWKGLYETAADAQSDDAGFSRRVDA